MSSSVDLEVDQSALWVLFRRPNLSSAPAPFSPSLHSPLPYLTVLKLSPNSLKELATWELEGMKVDERRMVNAFVACGRLYAVEAAGGSDGNGKGEAENDYGI